MANTSKHVKNINSLSSSHFVFKLDNFPDLNFTVQSCNLPGISGNPVMVPTSVGNTWQAQDKLQYEILTMSFIVDESLQNWLSVYHWLRALAPTHLIGAESLNQYKLWYDSNKPLYGNGVLFILTNSLHWNIKISLRNIFPISLSGLSFSTTDTSDRKLYSTINFAYDYYDIEVNPEYNDESVGDNKITGT